MPYDAPFRVALGAVLAALAVVRTYYQVQARRSGPATQFESPLNIALRAIAGLAGFTILVLYLARPDWLASTALALPPWLRWLGAAGGVAGVLMLSWVHRELGRNFSGTLHLRAEHTLVTTGPYRRIRHPMYTAFFCVVLSFFLLSANGLIGAIFIGSLSAVIFSRVAKEEQVMSEKFGPQYQAWAAHTGRFLPRLRP